jgi:hypothetical protein
MEIFQIVISAVVSLFKYEMNIYGFAVSYWQILLFLMVVSLTLHAIARFFYD